MESSDKNDPDLKYISALQILSVAIHSSNFTSLRAAQN